MKVTTSLSIKSILFEGSKDPTYTGDPFSGCSDSVKYLVPKTYSTTTFCGKKATKILTVGTCGTTCSWLFDG
ncbi:MAG: hypothetical protein J6A59_11210, partial [Lachnospiraceae bacterium]|nr:hypothetical protein [Lachnospiraceae bacterium]